MRYHLAYAPRSGKPNWCYEHLRTLNNVREIPVQNDRVQDELKHFRRLQALPVQGPVGFGCSQRDADLRAAHDELEAWMKQAYEADLLAFPTPDQKQWWFYTFDIATLFWYGRMQEPDHDWPCVQFAWMEACEKENEPDFISGGHAFLAWGEQRLPELIESWEDRDLAQHVEEAFEILSHDWEQCQAHQTYQRKMARIRHLHQAEEAPTVGHRPVKRGTANVAERTQTSLHVPQLFESTEQWESQFRNLTFDQWAADRPTPRWKGVSEAPLFWSFIFFLGGDVQAMCMTG